MSVLVCGLSPGAALGAIHLCQKPSAAQMVDQGVQLYYEGRYRQALELLGRTAQDKSLNETRKLGALQYMAFCQVALGDVESARKTFTRLVQIRTDFRLPAGTAPKIVSIFEEVQASLPPLEPSLPPGLHHSAPSSAIAGGPLELEATVDNAPPDGRVEVHYRYDPRAKLSRQRMMLRADGRYTTTIPAPLDPTKSQLTYFITLVDGQGRQQASAGSEREPFRLTFSAPMADGGRADEDVAQGSSSNWWIWPVVGAVLLGAGLAVGLGLAGDDEATGSALVRFNLVDP